jgi:hypothetical protein
MRRTQQRAVRTYARKNGGPRPEWAHVGAEEILAKATGSIAFSHLGMVTGAGGDDSEGGHEPGFA